VAGAACAVCVVCWLLALSAGNLNPPQPIPASAASPRAILLPEAPGPCLTKNGKNRQMKTNAARSLQWSDFGKKVGNPTKCPILVRIWWDF